MKIEKVEQYDYKLKIIIQKSFLETGYKLSRKVWKIMDKFPNYNMHWDNNKLIVNIFFDNTGWDSDRSMMRLYEEEE